MRIKINRVLWESFELDRPDAMRIARASFYLGNGVLQTKHLIGLGLDHEEVRRPIDIATDCGLNFDDYIIDLGD